MKIIKVKLSDLHMSDVNVRMHPTRQITEYVRSIKMFGQIRPIIIDETNTILAGNGLYMAMQQLELETADCVQYKDLTEKQKKKLMLADNKIYELGAMDSKGFDQILKELEDDLDVPGWDEDLLKTLTASANEVAAEISSYGSFDGTTTEPIKKIEERREGVEAVTTEPYHNPDPETQPQEQPAPEQEGSTPAEQGRFVVCPKCGEKIWL